jgi:hypothetical protein
MQITAAMVARKPGRQGEHEGNRKTIAQGMPDEPGEPVADYLVHFLHETTGASDTRHSLRPLLIEGKLFAIHLGVRARGERGNLPGCLKFESESRKGRRSASVLAA